MGKIEEIKKEDSLYPRRLRDIKDPPSLLRYKGNIADCDFENSIAVVGSRRLSSYGKLATQEIVKELSLAGITVISGFMYGVDAIAHQTALSFGGKTVAVMPCGLNIIHPAHQEKLYHDIVKKGVIFSEFDNSFPPERWTYPKRNRIVVGVSKATLVVEAEEKSGSLISASIAKQEKRKLFAVPGPIFSKTSKGTNLLIKEGFTPVTSASDILSFFGKTKQKIKREKEKNISKEEKEILDILKREPLEADEIAKKAKTPIAKVNTALSMLEINGLVQKRGNKYHPTS